MNSNAATAYIDKAVCQSHSEYRVSTNPIQDQNAKCKTLPVTEQTFFLPVLMFSYPEIFDRIVMHAVSQSLG